MGMITVADRLGTIVAFIPGIQVITLLVVQVVNGLLLPVVLICSGGSPTTAS